MNTSSNSSQFFSPHQTLEGSELFGHNEGKSSLNNSDIFTQLSREQEIIKERLNKNSYILSELNSNDIINKSKVILPTDGIMNSSQTEINNLKGEIYELRDALLQKDTTIDTKNNEISKIEQRLNNKNIEIKSKDELILKQLELIKTSEDEIQNKYNLLKDKDNEIQKKDAIIAENDEFIRRLISEKLVLIQQTSKQLNFQREIILKYSNKSEN